jgi:hypothetical protein
MIKHIMAVATMLLAANGALAQVRTGNDLLSNCAGPDSFCTAWVLSAVDMHAVGFPALHPSKSNRAVPRSCNFQGLAHIRQGVSG